MLDIARNDPDGSLSYFGAPYNYYVNSHDHRSDMEPGYEREACALMRGRWPL